MSVSGWRIAERDAVQKAIEHAPLQVREKYEFWKARIEDEGPLGVRTWKGFRDHALKGEWSGHRSSYLNEKYRVIYRFDVGGRMVLVDHVCPHDY